MSEAQLQMLEFISMLVPSPAFLAGIILFSMVGITSYSIGRRAKKEPLKKVGVVLLLFPYIVGSKTFLLYLVGISLCISLLFFRTTDGKDESKGDDKTSPSDAPASGSSEPLQN